MPTHAEKRILPYTQKQLFDLVADVEAYPAFLPWCLDCRIIEKKKSLIRADLTVGYKVFRETFTSEVTLTPHSEIQVSYLDGPFRYLKNTWGFIPKGKKATEIDFFIDFEFRNHLFQMAMGVMFNEAVRRMMAAFETRALGLYGEK